jgi:hypothetical protein
MVHATGTRLLAAACFIIGGLSVIGIPILWPAGYVLWKKAKAKEAERERELEALEQLSDS